MKRVLVLGAGILGVHTAYFLRQRGYEVTVIDRQPGPALETSFANGSQISVSQSDPWASPHAPFKILKWLGKEDAPLLFRLKLDVNQWRWGLRFLYECLPSRAEHNTLQAMRLSEYSRRTLQMLRKETGIQYDHAEAGIMMIHSDAQSFDDAAKAAQLLIRNGERRDVLSVAEAVRIEPALAHTAPTLAGAIYAPNDESGDAYKFTIAMAEKAAAMGVEFRYNTTIKRIDRAGGEVSGVVVTHADRPDETLNADAYVVALGSYSSALLRDVGVDALVYPAKGYSATLPIVNQAGAPKGSITDDEMKIVFTTIGQRLRIAGTAELNGFDTTLNPVRCEALTRRAKHHFPDLCDWATVEYWTGLRPATPSNLPIIGQSKLKNLYLNTGHGTLGWTEGPGSARALADIIAGQKPEVDYAFLGMQ
ncbi:MAG TPA: D-amino acid dehydrogenase [Casimicrobium sp.]|jgi:D-amino-acid dehydrogenase|nr:D-amino acid dehydrogenase [Casimicrobium sp.]